MVTNGADYFAYYLGNGAGGNIGLFAGLSNPTFSTFGRYGSLYMDGNSPGLPYYNNNGTTGWDRLVGESSAQTLSNKTFGATTFTGTIKRPLQLLPLEAPPQRLAQAPAPSSRMLPLLQPAISATPLSVAVPTTCRSTATAQRGE